MSFPLAINKSFYEYSVFVCKDTDLRQTHYLVIPSLLLYRVLYRKIETTVISEEKLGIIFCSNYVP